MRADACARREEGDQSAVGGIHPPGAGGIRPGWVQGVALRPISDRRDTPGVYPSNVDIWIDLRLYPRGGRIALGLLGTWVFMYV